MRWGGVVVIAIALARTAGAQGDPRLAAIIDSARASGLPTDPLVDKAQEGAAKHADNDRIVAAVRTLSAQLRLARTVLGPQATTDELSAGASALRAGVRPEAIGRLRAERPGDGSLTIPLAVMAELVARGASPDSAAARVLALTRRGVADAQLASVPREATNPTAPPAQIGAGAATSGGSAADASPTLNNLYRVPPPPPPAAPHKP